MAIERMQIDGILRRILGKTRVVNVGLEKAVGAAVGELWPDVKAQDVRISDFRRGVLHVAVDSHARLAEARGFLGESLRKRVNELIEADRRDTRAAGRREAPAAGGSRAKDAPFVTRVVFRVSGTV